MLVSVERAGQRYCRKPREQVQGCIQRATRLVGLPSQRARNVLTILAAVAPSRCRRRYSLVSGRGAAATLCFEGHAANTLGIGRTPVRSTVAQGTQILVCTLPMIGTARSREEIVRYRVAQSDIALRKRASIGGRQAEANPSARAL